MNWTRGFLVGLVGAIALVAGACAPADGGGGGSAAPNTPPTAVASATPSTGVAPLLVTFSSAGSSDPDGLIIGYSWNFGDGSPLAAGADLTHTYLFGGRFVASLTVTDNGGLIATTTTIINA